MMRDADTNAVPSAATPYERLYNREAARDVLHGVHYACENERPLNLSLKNQSPRRVSTSLSPMGDRGPLNLSNRPVSVEKVEIDGEMLDGWTKRTVFRQSGQTAGHKDVYYYSPMGKKFRSKADIIRFVQSGHKTSKRITADYLTGKMGPAEAKRGDAMKQHGTGLVGTRHTHDTVFPDMRVDGNMEANMGSVNTATDVRYLGECVQNVDQLVCGQLVSGQTVKLNPTSPNETRGYHTSPPCERERPGYLGRKVSGKTPPHGDDRSRLEEFESKKSRLENVECRIIGRLLKQNTPAAESRAVVANDSATSETRANNADEKRPRDLTNSDHQVTNGQCFSSVDLRPDRLNANEREVKRGGVETRGETIVECYPGWTRHVVQRQNGVSAGKYDVYYFSPEGRKFRSKSDLVKYSSNLSLDLDVGRFDFSKRVSWGSTMVPADATRSINRAINPSFGGKTPPSGKRKNPKDDVINVKRFKEDVTCCGGKLIVKMDFKKSKQLLGDLENGNDARGCRNNADDFGKIPLENYDPDAFYAMENSVNDEAISANDSVEYGDEIDRSSSESENSREIERDYFAQSRDNYDSEGDLKDGSYCTPNTNGGFISSELDFNCNNVRLDKTFGDIPINRRMFVENRNIGHDSEFLQ